MPQSSLLGLLDDIEEQAVERIMDIMEAVIESQLGPDGRAYGDVDVSRADRIARVLDLAERGVMDVLAEISPPTYEMLMRDLVHDMAASQLIRSA